MIGSLHDLKHMIGWSFKSKQGQRSVWTYCPNRSGVVTSQIQFMRQEHGLSSTIGKELHWKDIVLSKFGTDKVTAYISA